MKKNNEYFEILRTLNNSSQLSQREMAKKLGFSLGKLNYCLKELKKKGLLKLKNFSNQKKKITYLQYVLTPKGVSERTKLTMNFMQKKMREYEELSNELKKYKIQDD